MSITRGLVYASQDYRGEATPAAGTLSLDRSREKNTATETSIGYTKIKSGLWVFEGNAATDNILIPNNNCINFTYQNFTLMMWINSTSLASENWLFSKGSPSNDMGYHIWISTAGAILFRTSSGAGLGVNSYTASGQITINTWNLISITRNSTSGKIYKNGVDITSSSAVHANLASSSTKILYMSTYNGASSAIIGNWTLSRIWQRALSIGEIRTIYESERSLFGL